MATKKVPIEGWQTGIGVMGEGATTGGISGGGGGGRDGWDGITGGFGEVSGTEWL
jgi:hypothetical protein